MTPRGYRVQAPGRAERLTVARVTTELQARLSFSCRLSSLAAPARDEVLVGSRVGLSHEVLPDPEAIDVELCGLHRVATGRIMPGLVSLYLLAIVQKRATAMGDRGNPLTWLALGCLNGEAFVQHRVFLHLWLGHPSTDRIGMGDRRLTLLQPSHRTKRNS
jgi:hypothetical protein